MNANIIKIADKIAKNEDISMDEFKFIKGYIFTANKWKNWNTDDVVSNFVLDIRENYNPEVDIKWKEAWIYAHIKKAIRMQASFDWAGTLYSPVPVALKWYDIIWWEQPNDAFQINEEEEKIEWIYSLLHNDLERDIYINCILWKTPVAYIAKEHWKSAQWWKIVKDRIGKRIKDYIENARQ